MRFEQVFSQFLAFMIEIIIVLVEIFIFMCILVYITSPYLVNFSSASQWKLRLNFQVESVI